MATDFNIDGAGDIILNEMCGGDPEAAIELLADTELRCEAAGKLTPAGAEQLRALRDWMRAKMA